MLFVVFVVAGLACVFVGKALAWSWVRNRWFRVVHLASIGTVALLAWLGVTCPFTTLEMALRARAGEAVYAGSFIAHWLEPVLYYPVSDRVFTIGSTMFGIVVVASWFWVRPRRPS